MSIDSEILNKIKAYLIQQYLRGIIHHDGGNLNSGPHNVHIPTVRNLWTLTLFGKSESVDVTKLKDFVKWRLCWINADGPDLITRSQKIREEMVVIVLEWGGVQT